MPHGGRRRGAGAPKGNLNALRGGRHSHRMRLVYKQVRKLGASGQYYELIHDLHNAGFIVHDGRRYRFNRDVPAVVQFLYEKWFLTLDRTPPATINSNQDEPPSAPEPPDHPPPPASHPSH